MGKFDELRAQRVEALGIMVVADLKGSTTLETKKYIMYGKLTWGLTTGKILEYLEIAGNKHGFRLLNKFEIGKAA